MNRGMNNVWSLVIVSAVVYGVLAIFMGTIPGMVLSRSVATPGLTPYTSAEQRGRDIYIGEGCGYCHTQYVRPLQQDQAFGRPSVAGDFAYDTPELLGSERTGPDLTNIGNRQPSKAWQYLHLWDPRSVVHDSIMPRYTWLFEVKPKAAPGEVVVSAPPAFAPAHGVIVATQRAQDLVDYLESLKQVPLSKAAAP